MPSTKHIFVGRKTELDQFHQALGQPSKIRRFFFTPGHGVKPRLFLPFGVGGIGKTELAKKCLKMASDAGWKTIHVDWERVEYRPVEPVQLMNAIAEGLREVAGKSAIQAFLDDRDKVTPTRERVERYKLEEVSHSYPAPPDTQV